MSLLEPRLLKIVLAVSLLFNIGFVVAAVATKMTAPEPVSPPVEAKSEPGPRALDDSLGLTPAQEVAFDQRRAEVSQEIADLRQQVRQAREELWRRLASEAPEAAGLEAQMDHIAAVQREAQAAIVRHMLWMRGQLVPAQQERFDGFVKSRMCSCPGCDGGCLGGCSSQCSNTGRAQPQEHSTSECSCGH